MNVREQSLSIEEAREMDMVDYLSKSGHEPVRIRNNGYWYLSLLQSEKTPSFKVTRKLNRWYDHGLGKGGNIIDFGILYHNSTVAEFLQKISGHFSFQQPLIISSAKEQNENMKSKISIRMDGSRIDTFNIGRNQSENIRKEIEHSFGLVRAEDSKLKQAHELKQVAVQRVQYGRSETKRAILNVLDTVLKNYKYTSLPELNAVLQQYNILAERGAEN